MNSLSEAFGGDGDRMDGMDAVVDGVAVLAFRSFATKTRESSGVEAEETGGGEPASRQEREARNAALAHAISAAREAGYQAGESEGRGEAQRELEATFQAALGRQREHLGSVVEAFASERARYFAGVEQEVVKLALAIAARVLHREAQMDGLLLSGAVRVALEAIADRSSVVLRTAAEDVAAWEESFSGSTPGERPRVLGDAALERGSCVLETKMGTVDLGVTTQLEEIEKGFFDLLHHRPR